MTKSIMFKIIAILIGYIKGTVIFDNQNGNEFTKWVIFKSRGSSSTDVYNSQVIFGGQNNFGGNTQIQIMTSSLPAHDSLLLSFKVIIWDSGFSSNGLRVQIDDKIWTRSFLTNIQPQIIDLSLKVSHRSVSALVNIQPVTSFDWGLFFCTLEVKKQLIQDIYLIHLGFDYKLIYNTIQDVEGWVDLQNQYIILNCADFQFVSFQYSQNITLNNLMTPDFDFFSIYFKVISKQLLQYILLVVDNQQLMDNSLSTPPLYSCSNTNMNYYYMYQLSFENIVLPYKKLIHLMSIDISSALYNFGIRDFEIHFYKYETVPPPIIGCSEFQLGQCLNCLEGWNYQNNQKICLPICGDKKIQYGEQCDDGNNVPYDGCYQCKFQCQQNCDSCVFGVCQRYKVQTQIALLDCNSNPLVYNIYNESQKKRCKSFCGDGIVDLQEECDDTNNSQYDGCFQCKFSCPLNCKKCISGRCNQCLAGYYLQKNSCQPICGDNIKQNEEQCDDGNLILFDGCYKCQNNCKLGCLQCINSYCLQCMDGWHFNNGECEQICGDNQVAIISSEQCDSNSILSCLNCEIKCAPFCSFCENLTNCFQCYGNILLVDGQCITYCGDGVVTDWEQCDDANNIQNDGCFNCKFECIFGCLECSTLDTCDQCDSQFFYLDQLAQKCILYPQTETYDATDSNSDTENNSQNNANNSSAQTSTNSSTTDLSQSFQSTNQTQTQTTILINNSNSSYGYNISESTLKLSEVICKEHYILINGICVSLCGNGVLESDYEECDDGNQDGGDGCSFQCYVEESYKCVNVENSISQCTYLNKPNFVLTLLSDLKSAKQIVEISFTQQIKLASQVTFEEIASFTVSPGAEFFIYVVPIVNATTTLTDAKYNIIVEFQQSVNKPKLEVNIEKSYIYSEQVQELQEFNQIITLGSPFVLSKQTQNQVTSIVGMNNAMMYSMASISGLALLTGNAVLLFNLLDLLQQLSYLRLMRFSFPDHLRQFLESFSKVSLKPLIDQLHIDDYIAKLNGGSLPFSTKSSQKQQQSATNTLNTVYLMNAKSCYISLIISLLTYTACAFIVSNKYQRNFFSKIVLNSKFSITLKNKLFILNQKVRLQCNKIKQHYFFSGVFQFYQAILHQFTFSALLQFPEYKFDTIFDSLNSLNAITSLIIIICPNPYEQEQQKMAILLFRKQNQITGQYILNQFK